ncbi:23S rRNA (pseudouridine(1915)-N(3))-methyltransferase RlmH [Carboxylicivirga sp. M1479]|uniref:23S rRNA (pseudouridine(1915)-N(3))-methyltransferase RlmH n=1 Tax=Carboxylicivirga sp. M1479 TaxID=2594476 RepID=UPI00117843F4|nr:23S rRNA (pseudouridine(1915)-N(3))-methyltransferase RlmH [Carboxylicivirga sp. M1479]TRX66374.1 23S rRNA (pseudouridine(1915)-N(3))-methyltransferase RlmH [Carboxylicivirga sp. M1479]
MKIILLVIGKTDDAYLKTGIEKFEKRLKHYLPYEMKVIPDLKKTKNLSTSQQKTQEGQLIVQNFNPGDFFVLLDENGKNYSSIEFSKMIEQRMVSGLKRLVFVIGGPYGFSDEVYAKAHSKISLSKMTFSHQMVRLIFTEQLYRAMTILKNEPYHHE